MLIQQYYSQYVAAIIVAAIRVAGGVVGIFLVQACPRVVLSMVMMTLMSVAMAALGCVHYIQDNTPDSSTEVLDIIPVLAVTLYMFCFGAGSTEISVVLLRHTPQGLIQLMGGAKGIQNSTFYLFVQLRIKPPGRNLHFDISSFPEIRQMIWTWVVGTIDNCRYGTPDVGLHSGDVAPGVQSAVWDRQLGRLVLRVRRHQDIPHSLLPHLSSDHLLELLRGGACIQLILFLPPPRNQGENSAGG